jgi:hypothetical protein
VTDDFDVPVKTYLPAAQFKALNRIATAKRTTVGALVREAVRRQLTAAPVVTAVEVPSVSVGRAGRLFGPEQMDKLRELYDRGLSDVQIATALGYTTSTVHRRRGELGLPTKRPQFTPKALRS